MSAGDYIDEGLARGLSLEDLLEAATARLAPDSPVPPPRLPAPPPRTDPGSAPRVGRAIAGLDRYEDLGRLGVGGMAEVRRVRDRELGRTLALKVMHASALTSREVVARFREEAQATAQLQHPGIVPVYDLGELPDGRLWFTMKEVSGETLTRVIRAVHDASGSAWRTAASGWSLRRLVEALVQVCEAIAYAHERGVLHRDLKPSNVMVGRHGEVLVLDWGLVKVAGRPEATVGATRPVQTDRSTSHADHTLVGAVTGTPAYMPPEQATGRPDAVDVRSDIYALGAILYAVLTGRPPYEADSAYGVLVKVRSEAPRPLPAGVGPRGDRSLPPALVAACERAMARDPGARFQSAGALAAELRAWLDGARRRDDALAVVAQAATRAPEAAALRARAAALRAEAARLLDGVEPWRPESDKAAGWAKEDEAAALEERAELAGFEELQLLQASLTHARDLPEAHAALAARYRAEHASAEAAQASTARVEALLRQHVLALPHDHPDRPGHVTWLRGDGALTLVTDPPGAEVLLYRYEPHHRRLAPRFERSLGPTPLRSVTLPMGSYLCLLRHPERAEVRYPVAIGRGEHWDGVPPEGGDPFPIRLPTPTELGPDDCLVPAGWFASGGDPHHDRSLPPRRLWVGGRVFRRFPATQARYLAFLDDLVARGQTDLALRYAPRERGGTAGEPGALLVGFDGARFSLRPNADGTRAEPDWPVAMVDWAGAKSHAAWEAVRTGQPWRLPDELAWEKAARGVDGRFHPWGNASDPAWACLRESHAGRPRPHRVGRFTADESPYGVRDLAGGMQDWCEDRYLPAGPALEDARVPEPALDPPSTPGFDRVGRGGCWFLSSAFGRVAGRYDGAPSARYEFLGFRLARSYR